MIKIDLPPVSYREVEYIKQHFEYVEFHDSYMLFVGKVDGKFYKTEGETSDDLFYQSEGKVQNWYWETILLKSAIGGCIRDWSQFDNCWKVSVKSVEGPTLQSFFFETKKQSEEFYKALKEFIVNQNSTI